MSLFKEIDIEKIKADDSFKSLPSDSRRRLLQKVKDFNLEKRQRGLAKAPVMQAEIKMDLINPYEDKKDRPFVGNEPAQFQPKFFNESDRLFAREEKMKQQEQAFDDARLWHNMSRLSSDRDATDDELATISAFKANNPRAYDFIKNIRVGMETVRATGAKAFSEIAKTASWGILTDDSKALKMSDERGQAIEEMKAGAVGEVVGGITGSLVGLGAVGKVTKIPAIGDKAFELFKNNRKLAQILMTSTDSTVMFVSDSLLRNYVQLSKEGESKGAGDIAKELAMSAGFGATMGPVNAFNPANQVLRGVGQGGMGAGLGFLESLAYTGDIKEAGMNALINGFLQVATMPSMREYHRQIAKNNTIADMAEYYVDNGVVKNVQEGQKIAEEVLDRALKLGDEAFKPGNQRVILDRVLKGESEPMQIGYEAEGGKVLKPTEIVEGDIS